jgi:hypothetical protein
MVFTHAAAAIFDNRKKQIVMTLNHGETLIVAEFLEVGSGTLDVTE